MKRAKRRVLGYWRGSILEGASLEELRTRLRYAEGAVRIKEPDKLAVIWTEPVDGLDDMVGMDILHTPDVG